ncbi:MULTISPECIES: DUF4179 domain-containing protein [unclassified Bacillus (in: firmicutes)]|uniref:DUF4179 domain-containing protein n=1 Tax=unclassified Bacillus (in: firmicutes) TaxID=185979 RepID=UPI0008F335B8|nr:MULTISPECIES: DUF4179 domain-containing protein [unclassified Bacillus (in: firmicutes)]SFB11752.1 protein of unknown function [Bacillus sp. UNCCL13]SFQ90440.1 protein of unknown function [Bacillus sp. cl95]
MEKEKILKHLDKAIEQQVPDVWEQIQYNILKNEEAGNKKVVMLSNGSSQKKKKPLYKRLSIAAAVCLIAVSTFTFTPAFAAIQEMYDKLFSSEHIDDKGLKSALDLGIGQFINQTYYDKEHDITVQFQNVLTDDKETKLLLTYRSEGTDLKNYYIDNFEGDSKINLILQDGKKISLDNVGWGSRYYDSKENKVAKALSFESIKEYEGQDIRLEIENLTIYEEQKSKKVETVWPVHFKLDPSATSDRETLVLNTEFTFQGETYTIKQVEFSDLETRVVVTGSDTKLLKDENGMEYKVRSKLESQYMNARMIDKQKGYIVDEKKSGVFLKSAGEKVEPIFNKGEVEGEMDEYLMIFAPVKNKADCMLEIGDDIKIPLYK